MNLRIIEFIVKKRMMKSYPSQAAGILLDEQIKWLAISSQMLINPNQSIECNTHQKPQWGDMIKSFT